MIRSAGTLDAGLLATILSDWIDETPWMRRLHTRDEDHAFVAGLIERGGVRVAGECEGFLSQDGDEIDAIYLAGPARGRGLGRALIDDAKADADHLTLWTFAANEGARRFYDREGFVETETTDGDNDEGLPDVRMEWRRA